MRERIYRAALDRDIGNDASGWWVFPCKNWNEPLSNGTPYWPWIMALGMAGFIPDVRLHDQRHAQVLHAIMNGESLRRTDRLLGHRRAPKTSRYYHLHETILSLASEPVPMALGYKLL